MTGLRTFRLPPTVTGSDDDAELGRRLIAAWRTDGILQIAADAEQDRTTAEAMAASRRFFHGLTAEEKSRFVSDLSYSGYLTSGEEVTDGIADYSEIFTVCKDVPLDDSRVTGKWLCHGPVPWPDERYPDAMCEFVTMLGGAGDRILQLAALGLGIDTFTKLTADGWHHLRVLRFPTRSDGEDRPRNGLPDESAGCFQDAGGWHLVAPVERVFTVFPGDVLQFLTGGRLLSTPHKVLLDTRGRFTMAYFHEPTA